MSLANLAVSLIGWVAKLWPGIEPLFMNVQITSPGSRDKVQFGWLEVQGTYRTTLGKNLVIFHRSANVFSRSGSLSSEQARDVGALKFTSAKMPGLSIRSLSQSPRRTSGLCSPTMTRCTMKLSDGWGFNSTYCHQA
jgi:hypothetical protein